MEFRGHFMQPLDASFRKRQRIVLKFLRVFRHQHIRQRLADSLRNSFFINELARFSVIFLTHRPTQFRERIFRRAGIAIPPDSSTNASEQRNQQQKGQPLAPRIAFELPTGIWFHCQQNTMRQAGGEICIPLSTTIGMKCLKTLVYCASARREWRTDKQ